MPQELYYMLSAFYWDILLGDIKKIKTIMTNPVGRPRKEKILKTVGFRVDPDAYELVKKKYGKTVSKKVNQFIIRLSKRK